MNKSKHDNLKVAIRKLSVKDAAALKQIIDRKETYWNAAYAAKPRSLPEAKKYIRHQLKIKDYIELSILADDKFVGTLSIEKIDRIDRTANIGYWVAKSYRNKGIATASIRLAAAFIFEKLKLKKIYAEVGKDNLPSIRALEKAGFSKETRPNRKKTEYVYSIIR